MIGFPDLDAARAWYDSRAYQEILPLRTRNSDGVTLLVDGIQNLYVVIYTVRAVKESRRGDNISGSPPVRMTSQISGRAPM